MKTKTRNDYCLHLIRNCCYLALAISTILVSGFTVTYGEMLTWEDCTNEARQNNPDFISAREKINQAKANEGIARSQFFPQITSGASANVSGGSGIESSDSYSYSVSGRQLLFDGFKTIYDVAQARESVELSYLNYDIVSSNVRQKLRVTFVQLLEAEELVKLAEDIADRRKKNAELVKLRYEAGREHRGSLLTAEAKLLEAKFEVALAKRNLSLAKKQLNIMLGRQELLPIEVTGDFDIKYPLITRPDFNSLVEAHPYMKQLAVEEKIAKLSLKSAIAGFSPQLNASGSIGRSGSNFPLDNGSWSAGVSLSFPIFEGKRRKSEVSKAKSVFSQSQTDKQSGRDSILLTLEESYNDLQNAVDKVEVQKKFLEAAEERAKIAQAQYSAGLISFDNWTIIEDELVSSRKAFLSARANALLAGANWIHAKGGTLEYDE